VREVAGLKALPGRDGRYHEDRAMRRLLVRLALGIGIALAVLLLLSGIYLTFNPNLITGRSARVTITSITIDEQAGAKVSFDGTCSGNTWEGFRMITDGVGQDRGGAMGGGGFPGFPARINMTVGFDLVGPGDRGPDRQIPDRETLAKRILVEAGRTYVVRVDRPLTLYRFTDGDGHVHEGQVVIYPAVAGP
jgi:hypothetical protein